MTPVGQAVGFCSIVSKNYVAQARALAHSLRRHHPESRLIVLFADRIDGYFDPALEPFDCVELESLFIPDLPRVCFQYTVVELATAAKPYFLQYLFQQHAFAKLFYLDPDMLLFERFDALCKALDEHSILLTPHLAGVSEPDGKRLNEVDILRAGTYNLGFLGLAEGTTTSSFLGWWKQRLYSGCRMDLDRGMHLDQKWVDLVPGFFADVGLIREPGYNVAYWNLHQRSITRSGDRFLVNGKPLYLYHFSGFDPARPEQLSKHQDRFKMNEIGAAEQIYAEYRMLLHANGHEQSRTWPNAYANFDNGVPIPEIARRLYLEMGASTDRFGNPFRVGQGHSFYRYLTEPVNGELPRLFREIYRSRYDLNLVFSDIDGANREQFLSWAATALPKEYAIDPRMLFAADADYRPRDAALFTATQIIDEDRYESSLVASGMPFGVNLAGYLHSEKGVGEAARAVIRSLEAADIPFVVNNVQDSGSANCQSRHGPGISNENPFAVNLIQINADQVPHFLGARPDYLRGRYNVGYWNWELCDFPAEWRASFAYFDEIWVPSSFTRDAVAEAAPIPVHCVPFSIAVPDAVPPGCTRQAYRLPAEPFLFLYAFDFHSYLERKNPLGLIAAFRCAFGDRSDVGLVLKSVHAQDRPADWAKVRAACAGARNIHLLDRVLDRDAMHGLMMLADAYVSLHRAEGYGLGLAEAMAMGKPAIGTAYSAPLDFMNHQNSALVRHRLVMVHEDHGPYRQGSVWAEPDIHHASQLMRRVAENPRDARRLGLCARQDIARDLNSARIGELIYSRLMHLVARRIDAKTRASSAALRVHRRREQVAELQL